MALDLQLTYAGVPFVSDSARVVRSHLDSPEYVDDSQVVPKKHQPLTDLQDEINRIIPFHYLRDFSPPSRHAGKNLSAIARNIPTYPQPDTEVKIGDWYYPNGASRWSVFRGLATSSQVKEMLAQTGGSSPATFVMQMNPLAPNHPDSASGPYTLISSMYMLPPRPLAEHGGAYDGLYLVTLVDERYYFRYYPVCLRPTPNTTWTSLLSTLTSILHISLTVPSISSTYGTPEPDSQLWSNFESAGALLDAVALNVGTVVVRNLDGSYSLLSSLDSQAIVTANRGNAETVVRAAGGDIFYAGTLLPAGNLTLSKNSVVPSIIYVNFPKYITGNDPVPHYLNSRYANQRPTSWYEDSFGEVHSIGVPIQSGGSLVSGLIGTGTLSLHSTAKALYTTEASAASGMLPTNSTGLTALAMQLSQNLYNSRVAFALDEVYPGTYAWQPEGLHDIVWTYSQKRRQATTRVMRIEWNRQTDEFQHSHVPLAGTTNVPPGEGGQSVAQTWRDGSTGQITVEIANTMGAGDTTVSLNSSDCLPTQNRWKGQIDSEVILFEGTSGGTSVNIVFRGIDGTIAAPHANNSIVTLITPNQTYGANLVTSEKMQFVYPSDWTSGGIKGVNVVPQTQTIQVFDSDSEALGGVNYFSGQVQSYDTTGNLGPFVGEELVWAVERNAAGAVSGSLYGGQFAGFSKTIKGVTRPVYLFTAANSFNTTINYGSGTVINYTSGTTTINYYGSGSTTNILNDYITNVYPYIVWNVTGSGYINITAPTSICGSQFWCCTTYVFSSILVDNWDLPAAVTVFDLEGAPGGTTITGIKAQEFGSPVNTGPVTNATNASPIVLTVPGWTSQPQFGFGIKVTGINGNTAANGTWTVLAATATTVTLENTAGNGAFVASPNSKIQITGPNLIVLHNIGASNAIVLNHNDASSDPANRIALPFALQTGGTLTLNSEDSVVLWWDYCGEHVWKVLASTVGGGGVKGEHNTASPTASYPTVNFIDSSTIGWLVSGNAGNNSVDLTAAVASGSVTSGMLASGLIIGISEAILSDSDFTGPSSTAFTDSTTGYQNGASTNLSISGGIYLIFGQAVARFYSSSGGAGSCSWGTRFVDGGGAPVSTINQQSGYATFASATASGSADQFISMSTMGKVTTKSALRTIALQAIAVNQVASGTALSVDSSISHVRVG